MGCCADGMRPGPLLLFRSSPAPHGSRSFPPLEVLSCSSVAPRPSCELRQHGVNKTASPPHPAHRCVPPPWRHCGTEHSAHRGAGFCYPQPSAGSKQSQVPSSHREVTAFT